MNTSNWRFKSFAIQEYECNTNEGIAVSTTCSLNRIPKRIVKEASEVLPTEIPVGSVEFVESAIGCHFQPDYYPDFAEMIINRQIWKNHEFAPKCKCFVKPSDSYKRFDGFIYDGVSTCMVTPPFICSDVVSFKDEWRYYIQNGQVVFSNWYKGVDDAFIGDEPDAPELPFEIPKGTYGALDVGVLMDDSLELVEFQYPYACGWYGRQLIQNNEIYTEWLAKGYEHLVGLRESVEYYL